MKISKKTIIIVIIVAVVAYVLWKKFKGSGSATVEAVEASGPTSRLEQLIAGAELNAMEAELVRKFNPTGSYKEWIINDALAKGIDYESALLLNCLWNRYRNSDNTAFQSDAFKSRYVTIYNKVKAMN
jgi:hypothetical protein